VTGAIRAALVRHRALAMLWALLIAIALSTSLFGDRLLERIVTVMLINLILVLGFQVFSGNSGLLSFAQIGFMGIGAYTSAILTMSVAAKSFAIPDLYPFLVPIQIPYIAAVFVGAILGTIVAAAISFPIMRLSDAASVISTFALLVIVQVVLAHWSALTNGPRVVFGLLPYTDLPTATVWALVFVAVAWAFKHSSLGLKLRASRDSEFGAATIGLNIVRLRWTAFILSAFICAFAGGLWAHFITRFEPRQFYLTATFLILTMLIVGGPRTVSGAVAGTLIVTAAFEILRGIENTINLENLLPFQVVGLTEILLAIGLIVVLAVRPGGLIEEREILSGPAGPRPEPAGPRPEPAGTGGPRDEPVDESVVPVEPPGVVSEERP
jgi:branched-chain amino acid transport system permease protein